MQVMWMIGQNFKAVSQQVLWIGYLSSTSVYGDYNGDWVTEECGPALTKLFSMAKASCAIHYITMNSSPMYLIPMKIRRDLTLQILQ